jgi:hypothetical protein
MVWEWLRSRFDVLRENDHISKCDQLQQWLSGACCGCLREASLGDLNYMDTKSRNSNESFHTCRVFSRGCDVTKEKNLWLG